MEAGARIDSRFKVPSGRLDYTMRFQYNSARERCGAIAKLGDACLGMVGGEGVYPAFVLGAFFSHTPVPLEIACAWSTVVRLHSASIFVCIFVSYLRASFSLLLLFVLLVCLVAG